MILSEPNMIRISFGAESLDATRTRNCDGGHLGKTERNCVRENVK